MGFSVCCFDICGLLLIVCVLFVLLGWGLHELSLVGLALDVCCFACMLVVSSVLSCLVWVCLFGIDMCFVGCGE